MGRGKGGDGGDVEVRVWWNGERGGGVTEKRLIGRFLHFGQE